MDLLRNILVFAFFVAFCESDSVSYLKVKESANVNRNRQQIPTYLHDLYKQESFDNGKIIRAFFEDTGRDCYKDSCYSFNGEGKNWAENRKACNKKGGDLVSIETEGEWTFLKDKIQMLSNQLRNEWHIGLTWNGSAWNWLNNASLSIKKWQSGQPSGDGPYVVMAKNYPRDTKGLFNDLPGWMKRGYICETTKELEKGADEKMANHVFTFSGIGVIKPSEQIRQARLRIFKSGSRLADGQGSFEITVYRLTSPSEKDNKKPVLVDSKLVECSRKGEWIEFDVTSALRYWAKHKSSNYGLRLSARGRGVPSSDFKVASGGGKDSFLVEFGTDLESMQKANELKEEAQGGDKEVELLQRPLIANTNTGSTRSSSSICKLHSEKVHIEKDLNLKWVLAPSELDFNYCKGTCGYPIVAHLKPTSHAVLQNIVHSVNPKRVSSPCCSPIKYKEMTVLVLDGNNNVKMESWHDTNPSSCGCR